ncbi:hypothetical protein QAD02_024287 [Eretmocerus hayati]|uniref:Uncharacterized protein n=1 Tax=Eretmocerus hayati TaxID=131215 RepID=A0ACC2PYF3_9HYME|nr:hypothetical protein QAD02_024287 [Eretmocerus hayati]
MVRFIYQRYRNYTTEGELRLEVTQKLLELGADVNVANIHGSTAVHLMFVGETSVYNCLDKRDEVLNLLLNAGAEVNRLNDSGESPLSLAVKCGSHQMAKRIIDAGADVNLSKDSTKSALHQEQPSKGYRNSLLSDLILYRS